MHFSHCGITAAATFVTTESICIEKFHCGITAAGTFVTTESIYIEIFHCGITAAATFATTDRVSRAGGLAGFFIADLEGSCADSVHIRKSLCIFYLPS